MRNGLLLEMLLLMSLLLLRCKVAPVSIHPLQMLLRLSWRNLQLTPLLLLLR